MATHSSILPEKSHGQKSLVGYSPWGSRELDRTEQPRTHNKRSTAKPVRGENTGKRYRRLRGL